MSKLTEEPVLKTLFRMALPMLAGTIAMNTYNFIDTWFVAKLGTIPLAAMGFSFPVVTLLTFIAGGTGTGVTTLTSHALGRKNRSDASKIATHGILLVVIISALIAVGGYLSITPLFRWLGADSRTMPQVKAYMRIWYLGAVFMALPMLGNGILISLGDSKAASRFMVLGAVVNCVLDPVMIFGFAFFPAMGISGAALATVLSQVVSTLWLLYLLIVKHKLLHPPMAHMTSFPASCRLIFDFALPSILSMILMPVSSAVITSLVGRYGAEAVAAASAAGRVEMFSFMIPMALGMSLVPFVSQNYGGRHHDRILRARTYSIRFALFYGVLIAGVLFATAPALARLFSDDPRVTGLFVLCLRITSAGFGMMEVHRYCGFFFTGIHRPFLSTLINMIRVLVLLVPFSFLGSSLFGIRGIFAGRLVTDLIAGIFSVVLVFRVLKSRRGRHPEEQ